MMGKCEICGEFDAIDRNAVTIVEVNAAAPSREWHLPIAIHIDHQMRFIHDEVQMERHSRGKMMFNFVGFVDLGPFIFLNRKHLKNKD